jgi:hypothetical protein
MRPSQVRDLLGEPEHFVLQSSRALVIGGFESAPQLNQQSRRPIRLAGLGHHSFKVRTRVRIPYRTPINTFTRV